MEIKEKNEWRESMATRNSITAGLCSHQFHNTFKEQKAQEGTSPSGRINESLCVDVWAAGKNIINDMKN